MANKYHFSPKTNDAEPCNADGNCPYGDAVHGESAEEVLQAQGFDTVAAPSKKKKLPGEDHPMVQDLKEYMEMEANVIIEGEAGTGKTFMTEQAAALAGLDVKYYSTPTLDPYVDLIGVPKPNEETGELEFYRTKDMENAQVLIFDELNRADDRVRNAVMEIVQFRTINGVPLPRLQSVIAMINPADDDKYHGVEEIDYALMDRFDFKLQSEAKADYKYLRDKYGRNYAKAAVDIHNDYMNSYNDPSRTGANALAYWSPRNLEKVMQWYEKKPEMSTIERVMSKDVLISKKLMKEKFDEARAADSGKPIARTAASTKSATTSRSVLSDDALKTRHASIAKETTQGSDNSRLDMTAAQAAYDNPNSNIPRYSKTFLNPAISDKSLRGSHNSWNLRNGWESGDDNEKAIIRERLVTVLSEKKGANVLVPMPSEINSAYGRKGRDNTYARPVLNMSEDQVRRMTENWPKAKLNDLSKRMRAWNGHADNTSPGDWVGQKINGVQF